MLHSLNDFYTVKYNTSLIIENDDNPVLPLRMEMIFNNAPCHSIVILILSFVNEISWLSLVWRERIIK
jgi:hypothetical protein